MLDPTAGGFAICVPPPAENTIVDVAEPKFWIVKVRCAPAAMHVEFNVDDAGNVIVPVVMLEPVCDGNCRVPYPHTCAAVNVDVGVDVETESERIPAFEDKFPTVDVPAENVPVADKLPERERFVRFVSPSAPSLTGAVVGCTAMKLKMSAPANAERSTVAEITNKVFMVIGC